MTAALASTLAPAPFGLPARLAFAIACVLAAGLPVWGLLVWIARSGAAWRVAAESPWLRLLATIYATVGTLLATGGASHLLIPRALREQRVVLVVWLAQLALFLVATIWVKQRRGGGLWNPVNPATPRKRPPLAPLAIVVALWTALTGAWVVARFTSLSTAPPSSRERIALALSLIALATLARVLFVHVRAARRAVADGARPAPGRDERSGA